ncbi:armadillo-type protein [Radiomyces spectabilis]|uniref:armadillo-type protein n=1 Tax=Radiomyces spectabilis TaxID=64574 RepID=UPI00221FE7AB|nr:armadillo-type protein [Radiomyces spectabilis]KAI8381397.1 armadillo-type protein [Radiomyces spectabilis]
MADLGLQHLEDDASYSEKQQDEVHSLPLTPEQHHTAVTERSSSETLEPSNDTPDHPSVNDSTSATVTSQQDEVPIEREQPQQHIAQTVHGPRTEVDDNDQEEPTFKMEPSSMEIISSVTVEEDHDQDNDRNDGDELQDAHIEDEPMDLVEHVYNYTVDDVLVRRVMIIKEIPTILSMIDVHEAVDRVLPVLREIIIDPEDAAREALLSICNDVIMYFYKNAPPLFENEKTASGDSASPDTTTNEATPTALTSPSGIVDLAPPSSDKLRSNPHIPKNTFTPLFMELLLDQRSVLISSSRDCVVNIVKQLAALEGDQYQKIIDCDILQGVVVELMTVADGQHAVEDQETAQTTYGDRWVITSDTYRRSSLIGYEEDDFSQNKWDWAKLTCLHLITALADTLGSERCAKKCLPIVERLAKDPLYSVRKESVHAVHNLATALTSDVVLDRLLPVYQSLSHDTIWHVRQACVQHLPGICDVLSDDRKEYLAAEAVHVFEHDVSRNVRNTLAEIIGQLIAKFLPKDWEVTGASGKVPEHLLQFFLSLGSTTSVNQMFKLDMDRAITCAYNFPAVVLTAGRDYWDSHLRDMYLSLSKDYQIKVRCTFANSLHVIARLIGPKRAERDLIQIFALYLMDLDAVKQGVLEHMAEFLGTLAPNSRNEYIPILAEVWDGVMTNWRLRDMLASQLQAMALLFDSQHVVEHILPLAIRACQDEFATVRSTGVKAFPVILHIVKQSADEDGLSGTMSDLESDGYSSEHENRNNDALALLSIVMESLDEFARGTSYRSKLVFAHICEALLNSQISARDVGTFFLPRLDILAKDPVVNVRIAVARAFHIIYINQTLREELNELQANGVSQGSVSENMDRMLYQFALDEDQDVRFFVMDLVDPAELDKRSRHKMAAAEANTQRTDSPMQEDTEQVFASSPSTTLSNDTLSMEEDDPDAKAKSAAFKLNESPPVEYPTAGEGTDSLPMSVDEDELMVDAPLESKIDFVSGGYLHDRSLQKNNDKEDYVYLSNNPSQDVVFASSS